MTPPLLPSGAGPAHARLEGLRILLGESSLRLNSLSAVIDDVLDGVFDTVEDDRGVLQLIATNLATELRNLDTLLSRLQPLILEIRR